MSLLPSLFVSHGAPTLILEPSLTRMFLAGLSQLMPKPTAILVMSAHWCTRAPAISAAEMPQTVHDFYGFPEPLYQIRYPAPGAPVLAAKAQALLSAAGLPAALDPGQGLDHGGWVPLKLGWPEADIPTAQIAVQPYADPRHHFAIGAALRPLRAEGVLLLGSGSFTHNLGALQRGPGPTKTPAWAHEFVDWTVANLAALRIDDLLEYRTRAPHARQNHPTDEHLLPFHFALGSGTPGAAVERLHQGFEFGALAMDAFRFN